MSGERGVQEMEEARKKDLNHGEKNYARSVNKRCQ